MRVRIENTDIVGEGVKRAGTGLVGWGSGCAWGSLLGERVGSEPQRFVEGGG